MSRVKEAIEEAIEESYLRGLSDEEIRSDFKRFIDTCFSVLKSNVKDRESISALTEELAADAQKAYDEREQELGDELMRYLERTILLQVIDNRWREAHAGEWQGLTPDEIRRDWPGYLDDHRRPPGFEPVEQVVARTTETALELLRAAIGSAPTLVVSHSGVIRALRRHQGLPADRVPNLGGTWIHLVNGEVSVGDDFDPHAAPESSGFDEDAGDEPTRVG